MSAVLVLRDVRIARAERVLVDRGSLEVRRGEIVALMGASGSGKTTMLRAIAGLEPFAGGTIDVDGIQLLPDRLPRGRQLRDLHGRVGMVFQSHHLFAHMTSLHNVWLAPVHVQRVGRHAAEARARELLTMLGVGEVAGALPHELSGGEAQRVAIARALAVDPPLLLMDEPTASLDSGLRGELAATLRDLVTQGRTLLIATHDEDFARTCARRVIRVERGRLTSATDSVQPARSERPHPGGRNDAVS